MTQMELLPEAEVIRRLDLTADQVGKILHDPEGATRFYAHGSEVLFHIDEVRRIKAQLDVQRQ